MPIEAKARATAENCGWCQQGHATVKLCSKKKNLMEVKLKITPSLRRSLDGKGCEESPE